MHMNFTKTGWEKVKCGTVCESAKGYVERACSQC